MGLPGGAGIGTAGGGIGTAGAGIGGRAAHAVGEALAALGAGHQVLVVTHLPQVAALADHHVHVAKRVADGTTTATAVRLDDDGRVDELARMLAGSVTPTARDHARELLSGPPRP